MSHELRTPLNSILGMLRLVLDDRTIDSAHEEMLKVAQQSATNLLTIVGDLLDISKIEAGKLELEHIPFSLEEILGNTVRGMRPLSMEKGLTLTCNFPDEALPFLLGDPMRLSRVLVNLLGNAIKYTEKGSITVGIECEAMEYDTVMVSVSIRDTGIGIPAQKLDYIFEKYAQEDSSTTRRFGGTGLGLYITRQLINRMGGEIGVESDPGKGSCFWFRIPFVKTDAAPGAAPRPLNQDSAGAQDVLRKAIGDINVLVAEDHLLNQAFMQKLLPRMGVKKFKIVDNGQEALNEFARDRYDLILMDCHMPVMDGYDATMQIREKERTAGKNPVPIIAMTADAMQETRERSLKTGMNEYITKPVNIDELRRIIGHWYNC
jgi:CheY-like chemotaxis protein